MIFPIKTPKFLRKVYPDLTWTINTDSKVIFLTFDDGPVNDITPFVLAELAKYNAKATFFCIGDNIRKHPEIFIEILSAGHIVGNHTYNHLSGWRTDTEKYIQNIKQCREMIQGEESRQLFRPPYGRIKKSQINLIKDDFKIIMWDVLTGDFDKSLDPVKCLKKTISLTTNGSIVVFHDSFKAEKRIKYVLPKYLDHFSNMGYEFKSLSND